MKVAIVTQFPKDPEIPRGGVEAVSVNLVRALVDFSDLNIHVVTLSECSSLELTSWNGVTIHKIPKGKGSVLINSITTWRRYISTYLMNLAPDIVHSHDTYGIMVKGLKIPRVFTIHGFIYADTRVSKTRFALLRSKLWEWVEKKSWADQPYIISISPYVRERLRGISTGVIYDIENPVSEVFFNINRKEKRGTIFSASVISKRKNTLNLVKAFANLIAKGYNIELRLAGPVEEKEYGYLVQKTINELNLNNKIFLLGQISTKDIIKELSFSSIFALVSLEEGSPMGIAEAMAAGIPVVASNRCGMPYMVRHGETGFLVDPTNQFDITNHIKALLDDDELRERMGKKGHLVALDCFHPAIVARRTRAAYLEILTNSTKSNNKKL